MSVGDELTLTPDGCALLVIDVQERLIALRPAEEPPDPDYDPRTEYGG